MDENQWEIFKYLSSNLFDNWRTNWNENLYFNVYNESES